MTAKSPCLASGKDGKSSLASLTDRMRSRERQTTIGGIPEVNAPMPNIDDSDTPRSTATDDAGPDSRPSIDPAELLRQLYDAATDFAIITTDRDSHITSWNSGAENIFGYRGSEVLGASTALTFTPDEVASGQPFVEMQVATRADRAPDYRWHQRKDGSLFWADGVLTPIRQGDAVVGFLKILRDITERKHAQDKIDRLASIDSLTGVYNRAAFDLRRHELTSSATRHGQQLLLYMIDLDRFKEINDTFGHLAGDRVLSEVASRIRAVSRESDVVARIGGDEFALLHLNPSSPLLGAVLASKILHTLSLPFQQSDRELYLSASIGIAVYPDDAQSPDSLLKCADLALYEAKSQGRDCYHFYTDELNLIAHRRNMDQAELRRLHRKNGFSLVYQPLIEAASGNTVAIEALLRADATMLSSGSTDYVVELAKETGLISEIGNWVFAESTEQLQRWHAAGHATLKLAINTCIQELSDARYLDRRVEHLMALGLTPGSVELELTERDAIELDRLSTPIIRRLNHAGFQIVLDDFGTGYSSLSYLRTLPVTGLKLDKSFIRDVPSEADANAVAVAIITLARDLRLSVTAEGVENEPQLSFLRNAGCHAFQGYLFAQPMTADEMLDWLNSRRDGHQSCEPL